MPETRSTIQSFLEYLKYQKRYSQHTIVSYENDLKDFFDFIEDKYDKLPLSEVSASIVRSWLADLKFKKIVSKSINRKISTLKSFFKFQLRNEVVTTSPMAAISSLKVSKRLPSAFIKNEISTFGNPAGMAGILVKLN